MVRCCVLAKVKGQDCSSHVRAVRHNDWPLSVRWHLDAQGVKPVRCERVFGRLDGSVRKMVAAVKAAFKRES